MNFKTTYILFGLLLSILLLAALPSLTGTKPGAEGALFSSWKSSDVSAKDVTKIVIERLTPSDAKQVFVRIDKDRWKMEEPVAATVDGQSIERIAADLLAAKKETKGADLTNNLSQFGLDRPSMKVTLTAKDRTATVELGKVAVGAGATGSLVYVTAPDRPAQPTAIRRSDVASLLRDGPDALVAGDLFKSVSDYRPKDLILERVFNPVETVKSLQIKADKSEIALSRTSASTWQYEMPKSYGEADIEGEPSGPMGEPVAIQGMKPLFAALSALRANSSTDFIENVTDFKQYGLDPMAPEGLLVTLIRKNAGSDAADISETLAIGKKDEKSEHVFARAGNESAVVKIPANLVEPLKKLLLNPGALRDRNLLAVNSASVDGIDIQVGNDLPIELRKLGDRWRIFDREGKAADANQAEISALLSAISAKRNVKDFPDPSLIDSALGFDSPVATLALWVGGVQPDEKKPDSKEGSELSKPKMKEPTVKLLFGKKDKDLLFVQRFVGASKANLAVADSLLPAVTHSRLDYLDRILPSFVANSAMKLSFVRGNENFVVEKKKPDEKSPEQWTIVQPPSLAGRSADGVKVAKLLAALTAVKAEKIWAEKPSEAELDRWGLAKPKVQASVKWKLGEKEVERTYSFGADSSDGNVFARQSDRELVYSTRKSIVDELQSADVLDPTVLRIDPAKILSLKLAGWKESAGEESSLEFERKPANPWSIKGESKFKLNPAAVDAFVASISNVRAEKFVSMGSGVKPEFKLLPEAGGLTVVMSVEGEKDPVTLSIGAETEGKYYFSSCSKLPNDVFLVPKERFEKFKMKRASFASE